MIKRPRPGEDEDDILRMQDEYLLEKHKNSTLQPAAQVINLRSSKQQPANTSQVGTARKPSKYAQAKGLQKASPKRVQFDPEALVGDILEKNTEKSLPPPSDDNVFFPQVLPSILGDIVEKNVETSPNSNVWPMPTAGFPAVSWTNKKLESKINVHNELSEESSCSMDVDNETNCKVNTVIANVPDKSYIVTSSDAKAIHLENIAKLKKMSEEEILEEKQKLLSSLDSTVIEFLKKRRHKEEIKNLSINVKQENEEISGVPVSDCDSLWENDVLSHPEVGHWLHFNKLEKDKLEWMKGLENSKKYNDNEPYEARFDFKGYLMPYTLEYSEQTKTLFHHGDEPHRPGYSFKELFELSRSSVMQQRVMALNTLAGILEYWSVGTYKNVIEVPLSKILFIIRFTVDENKIILLEPALKALRNLIYNRIDEASLDALIGFHYGLQQPCLENDKSEIEDLDSHESELKDFHLAEIDIPTALVRTDIIQRMNYVLDTIRPSFNCVQYALQILTRLARDSVETARKIVNTENLIATILNNFVPSTSLNFQFKPEIVYNGKPILAALKLLRVLSLQTKDINEILVSRYKILHPISEYVCSGVDGTYGLRIQTEAFCILTNVLQFGIGVDQAVALSPVVVTALFKHVQGTDILVTSSVLTATHAAVVLQFLTALLSNSTLIDLRTIKQQIYPLLEDGMRKWMSQLSQCTDYSCAHLRLASSALDCWETIMFLERVSPKLLNDLLNLLPGSAFFKILANQMQSCSNLLSKMDVNNLNPTKNLTSVNSVVVDSAHKVLPVLHVTSPFLFLASLIKLLVLLNDVSLGTRFMELFSPYLKKVEAAAPALCDNWFTRVELDFLVNTVKLSSQMYLPEPEKDLLYRISSKLCYILRADKRYDLEFLFDNIVFNRYWFTAERLINLVSLSEVEGVTQIMSSIEEVKTSFCKVLQLNYVDTRPNVLLKKWQEPLLPRDWIYLPILHLYSQSQQTDATPKLYGEHAKKVAAALAAEKEGIIKSNLVWILFNEICFPDLLQDISVTDRFCRIMCVYLCDNSIFLDRSVNLLLQRILKILFTHKDSFNFNKKLIGLNNFQDLYTQFVEQFQGVSYGDATFAACVLVPLAQRHDARWRKLLWSEYAGALRALHCPAAALCGALPDYLQPPETDRSLLRSYSRALASGLLRPDTVAYRIATHHVTQYKQRNVSNTQ